MGVIGDGSRSCFQNHWGVAHKVGEPPQNRNSVQGPSPKKKKVWDKALPSMC